MSVSENDPIDRFLSQPAEVSAGDHDERAGDDNDVDGVRAGLRARLRHFFFEKTPSPYSAIAPRQTDGRRTKIFFFNGNGRGR